MDKALKIKLGIIFLLLLVSIFNYEQHFIKNTDAIYTFSHIPFMAASICFGVIISASVYNLALFVYIKSLQHLYYALAQLSTLFFLINLDSLFIAPFDEIFNLKSLLLFEISQLFMLFFSALFIQEFLQTYQTSKLHRLIRIILHLCLLDLFFALIFSHTILSKFIPIFIPIWLILSEAGRLIKDKDKPFYFLIYGWYLVLFTVALEYVGFIDITGVVFPFLHITFALESLILSLAISYKFKLLEDEKKLQQTLLLQQSRQASMGEMIAIIAHQWRQPLNFLSFSLMHIKKNCKNDASKQTIKEANSKLQYMSKTIEDFRNFYNPSKTKEEFDIKTACQNAIKISSIKVELKIIKNFRFFGNKNEFEQALLNIINNAKDVSFDRKIENPKIIISIDKPTITITDNAGGVEKKYLNKIFEPYFSTKKESDGIGLYIAKTIIEKEMGGKLDVKSDKEGSSFIIFLK